MSLRLANLFTFKRVTMCVVVCLGACTTAPQAPTPLVSNTPTSNAPLQPEIATGWRSKADVVIAAPPMGHYEDGRHGVHAPGDV